MSNMKCVFPSLVADCTEAPHVACTQRATCSGPYPCFRHIWFQWSLRCFLETTAACSGVSTLVWSSSSLFLISCYLSAALHCLSAAHTHNIKSLLSSSYSWLLQMPKNIWDIIQKYFLTLNKAQTYGSDTCATCKNRVKNWKSKVRKKGRKWLYLYVKLKTVVQLHNDWDNYHHCLETTSLRFV